MTVKKQYFSSSEADTVEPHALKGTYERFIVEAKTGDLNSLFVSSSYFISVEPPRLMLVSSLRWLDTKIFKPTFCYGLYIHFVLYTNFNWRLSPQIYDGGN